MLSPTSVMATQVRWSSSNADNSPDKPEKPESEGGESESQTDQPSGFASAFGFQSLAGLFQTSTRQRYGRHSGLLVDAQLSDSAKTSAPSPDSADRDVGNVVEGSSPASRVSFDSSDPSTESTPITSEAPRNDSSVTSSPESNIDSASSTRPHTQNVRIRRHTQQARIKKFQARGEIEEFPAWAQRVLRRVGAQAGFTQRKQVPNPFTRRRQEATTVPRIRYRRAAAQPWVLSSEDLRTVDSIVEPNAPASEIVNGSVGTPPASSPSPSDSGAELTHVKSSGEAHMVDVGAKAESRRVAIAGAIVSFSNPKPFQLIFENNNQKGDVLGVSRIAGIMAAKRTSDLIPLCHPLAISKAEVDVKLEAPHGSKGHFNPTSDHGNVLIRAQIECTGPTGVEMEALTAANAAALTVYDMCKAVDRSIRIGGVMLLYKNGGRSGMYVDNKWARVVGPQFFVERGIEMPAIASWKGVEK